MAATFVLRDSARIRYLTGSMMYFAQGIPQGLLAIAIPAWLASLGASASDIGTYLSVIVLPWAFKLVTGPFMDRYQFLPMGRRKPWVLGAQFGLTVSLLALMLIENPAQQIGLLMLIGVLINSFAATQDVAVDGMSIDLTPVREQGRLNAFMSFGKAVGWGVTSAISGLLLVNFGMQVTAIVAASVAGVVLVFFVLVLEREGERRLPWTAGKAMATRLEGHSFGAVFKGVNKVLWKRASVLVMMIMAFDGLVYGYGQALMPIAAVRLFGYTTPEWSQLVAVMGLIGAGVALALGPMIDRFGAKRMLVVTMSLVGVHAFLIAQTQFLWQDTTYVRIMLSIWILMLPVVMVCSIALAMAICSSKASATQLAIYMSVANLGHSAGSKIYATVADRASYVENYMFLGLLVIGMVIILLFHRHQHEQQEQKPREGARNFTVGTGVGGAGLYFSGAMRCPKCRADMEQIDYEGVEVDRCSVCNGVWFDEGEVEQLASRDAARAIDTGSARQGKKQNKVDEYRCPRCGGGMLKKTDQEQSHIWYETCGDCHGSFFDAGEFRDLAQVTVSDYFKRLVKPKRRES
ncbi:MAG: MFS transporter [Xanthomonadales bacterium]|nr:MFS transporter [Xanthomonadales bacterium]